MPGTVSWSWKALGEGASRWAYPAEVKEGRYLGWDAGTKLVVKVIKTSAYKEGVRMGDADIEAQRLTCDYAKEFNAEQKPTKNGESCRIHVRLGKLDTADGDKRENGVRRIVKGEKMLVEQRIHGEYEKFNSNSGWTANNGLLPDFFSHWSYAHSGGRLLICDLQGHKGRPGGPKYGDQTYYYLFTDPAVMSVDKCYGCTDLGEPGIANWFTHHVCNDMCRTAGIDSIRPDRRVRKACRRRSTYDCEF